MVWVVEFFPIKQKMLHAVEEICCIQKPKQRVYAKEIVQSQTLLVEALMILMCYDSKETKKGKQKQKGN